ncbi:MAG: hemagglutinin family protein [Microvirga sp.]|jgi:autotransporter adhesin|nr:hemagglutinin family protein [Microvirga sp.]
MIDDNRADASKRASRRVFANDWVRGGADSPSVRRRLMAVLRRASAQLGLRRRRGLGMLGIGGALAACLGSASPVLADASQTPLGFCVRPGFGGTGPWSCQVPKAGGGYAVVNDVPSDGVGGVDLATLTDWVDNNLGTAALALGNMTTSATGTNSIAIGNQSTASGAGATAVGFGATANGASSVAIGQGATAGTANSVALGAGSTTGPVVGTAGTTINGVDYAFAGTAPVGTVSVGGVGAERTITNVAAGQISASSTDAINGSQLYATNQAIEAVETGIGELNEFTVKYDTNPDGTKSNTVTLIGGDPNAPVLISNVAAGVKDTDAVNVGQLNEGLGNTLVEANSYTNQVAVQTLNQANAYTDYRFSQLNQDISAARTEARQGAAIGLAAASLRYDDRPGKASVAVGGGYWRGESAFAVGAGYTSENGRMRSNLSGATAGGDWGIGAGLSFTLN